MIHMNYEKKVSYSDWLRYVNISRQKGRHCDEFKQLQCSSPVLSGKDYDNYVRNELAKLESEMIKKLIEDFQASVNESFEEMDIYIFEHGMRELKKGISDCVFFDVLSGYSAEIKQDLKNNIRINFLLFIDEFTKYMKRLMEFENDPYICDFIYVYKKSGLKKFVQERT